MRRTILQYAWVAFIGILSFTILVAMAAAQDTRSKVVRKDTVAVSANNSPGHLGFQWATVANNASMIPGTGNMFFSSYGQPSVNTNGRVVFRARSTGGGERVSGIFYVDGPDQPIQVMADNRMAVPFPNNLNTDFTEFSAFPRIAMNSDIMTIRGLHSPVYRYFLDTGEETRIGNTGIYVKFGDGLLVTGASRLGAVPDFQYYGVPGKKAMAFDVFPGPQAITDDGFIVFKGNFTVNEEENTGIFFKQVLPTPGGGIGDLRMIASSEMNIPDIPIPIRFDSTSPPTAVGNTVLFLGLDNEDDPTYGGIYMADLAQEPELVNIAAIGQTFAGTPEPITRLGETIAFDGRYIAFWGAWGTRMNDVIMYCPEDGNQEIIDFCNGEDPKSIFDPDSNRWYQINQVPANQGIFVRDLQTGINYLAADNSGYLKDFMFWVYSGHIPTEEEDAEPPRWRGAAFVSVSNGWVAFKGRATELSGDKTYIDPVDGIYMVNPVIGNTLKVVVEKGMDGAFLDPSITGYFRATLPVANVGIERDGFRGNKLAITVTMDDGENSWGGIYLTNVALPTNNGVTKSPGIK